MVVVPAFSKETTPLASTVATVLSDESHTNVLVFKDVGITVNRSPYVFDTVEPSAMETPLASVKVMGDMASVMRKVSVTIDWVYCNVSA